MNWPDWLVKGVVYFNYGVLAYFIVLNGIYLGLFVLSLRRVWHFVRRTFFSDYRQMMESDMTWPISVLVPAHNEEKTIIETVRSLMMVNYTEFEIIVVNDGSTDESLKRLIEAFELRRVDRVFKRSLETRPIRGIYGSLAYPNLIVIDKEQGGKADALNSGINLSRYPLFCSIDADSMIEDNALLRVVKPFMEAPEETVAAGGIVRIANGCRVRDGRVTRIELPDRPLPIFQAVEYLRAFLCGRVGWSALQSLLIISGAFGIYSKRHILAIGGYSSETDTEDMELVVRLHRYMSERKEKYRVVFVPDPVCWTEVPSSLRTLLRQRSRWHRGLAQTLLANRRMLFNPRYGAVGVFAFPYFFVFEMLGPFVEILGYVAVVLSYLMGILSMQFFILFMLMAFVFGSFLSIGAVLLEELTFRRYPYWLDLAKLIVFGVLENLGYRQLLSLFKIKSFWDLIVRRRAWGRHERQGFSKGPDQAPDPPTDSPAPRTTGALVTLLLASVLAFGAATPAGGADGPGSDEMLREAQRLSREEGRREDARGICEEILEQSPDYTDVRVLLGRLWAWDGNYDRARKILSEALNRDPEHADARLALIDVELWSNQFPSALELAEQGLARRPVDPALELRRSRALDGLERPQEALESARVAFEGDPGPATKSRYYGMLDAVLLRRAGVDYDYETFDDNTTAWHGLSVDWRRRMRWGSIIGRVNMAHRFGDSGAQFEVDAYPGILRKTYAYLNFGVSGTDLFPRYRLGAEVFHNFRRGWEASLGFRRLDFSSSDVTIYTGSVAKYLGNYWISYRPNYVTKRSGNSFSNNIAVRRFLRGRFEYAELSVGGGTDSQRNFVTSEKDNLNAFRVRFEIRRRVQPRTIIKAVIGYRVQEFQFGRDRESIFLGIGVDRFY